MKILKIIPALAVGLVIALAGAVSPAGATTSDAPTLYTVDTNGVTLPSPYVFEASNHVNVKTAPDGTAYPGLHLDPNNGHPGAPYIGQTFIPWSAMGVPACSPVGWVQVGHNDPAINNPHYGEGGQPVITTAGCTEPPIKPKPLVVTDTKEVKDCEALTVTTVLTTTTTGWTLVENVWVKDEPVVVTASSERAATAEECPPVVKTPEPEAPSLAATGGTGPNIPFAIGVLALLLASIAILAGHIVRRRQLTQE